MKILGIGTSTNTGLDHKSFGSSTAVLGRALQILSAKGHSVRFVDAAKLHIVRNLSCYASGGKNCADPAAGKYRCWAQYNASKSPQEYGGLDQMPVIYDNLDWADAVIFATSVRWGSHTAVLQDVIERMNTLENRNTVYGEPNPLWGKRCGVIVTGQHWLSQRVSEQLLDVFGQMGFEAGRCTMFTWQRSNDMRLEQVGPNRPHVEAYMNSDLGSLQMATFIEELMK